MFVQIIEGLAKIISILGDGSRLRISNKRREIGIRLVALHQSISRIAENASRLEDNFRRIIDPGDDSVSPPIQWVFFCNHLFKAQRAELTHLSLELTKCKSVLDIYGDDLGQQLTDLIGFKGSFIRMMCEMLRDFDPGVCYFPRSLDLNDVPAFRDFDRSFWGKFGPSANYLDLVEGIRSGRLRDDFLFLLRRDESTESNWHYLKIRVLKPALEVHSADRLTDLKGKLGLLIKESFSVEELF